MLNDYGYSINGKAYFFHIFLSALLFFINISVSFAVERNIQFVIEADVGEWKAAGLKSLPQNSTLKIHTSSTHRYTILVVDKYSYHLLPKAVDFLLRKTVGRDEEFTIQIPEYNDYYLVVDNRDGIDKVSVQFAIRASYDGPAEIKPAQDTHGRITAFENQLNDIPRELEKIFIFTPFTINVESCGKVNVTTSSSYITLCLEFLQDLYNTFGNSQKGKDVLLFALFHEAGHILLYQWGYPFYDNEEIADEFAAILLVMLNKEEDVAAAADYFLSNQKADELMTKKQSDDRHPLSVQRARNILQYVKDKERMNRWVKFFMPHMQKPFLDNLLRSPKITLKKETIEKELHGKDTLHSSEVISD